MANKPKKAKPSNYCQTFSCHFARTILVFWPLHLPDASMQQEKTAENQKKMRLSTFGKTCFVPTWEKNTYKITKKKTPLTYFQKKLGKLQVLFGTWLCCGGGRLWCLIFLTIATHCFKAFLKGRLNHLTHRSQLFDMSGSCPNSKLVILMASQPTPS